VRCREARPKGELIPQLHDGAAETAIALVAAARQGMPLRPFQLAQGLKITLAAANARMRYMRLRDLAMPDDVDTYALWPSLRTLNLVMVAESWDVRQASIYDELLRRTWEGA
jgi:hypothetical protein